MSKPELQAVLHTSLDGVIVDDPTSLKERVLRRDLPVKDGVSDLVRSILDTGVISGDIISERASDPTNLRAYMAHQSLKAARLSKVFDIGGAEFTGRFLRPWVGQPEKGARVVSVAEDTTVGMLESRPEVLVPNILAALKADRDEQHFPIVVGVVNDPYARRTAALRDTLDIETEDLGNVAGFRVGQPESVGFHLDVVHVGYYGETAGKAFGGYLVDLHQDFLKQAD